MRFKSVRLFSKLATTIVLLSLLLCSIKVFTHLFLPAIAHFVPSVPEVAKRFVALLLLPEMWTSLFTSISRILVSLCLTVVVGLPTGILIGSVKTAYGFLRPTWDFLRSIPPSAMFPLFVVVFGAGAESKVATTTITATLIYALGVADASVEAADRRSPFYALIGVRRIDWMVKVILPSAFFGGISSLRIVTSIVVALTIVCEMFLGEVDGFGGMIINFSYAFKYADLLASVAISGVLGFTFNWLVDLISKFSSRRLQLAAAKV